jgi:hypothetical protein
MLSEQLINLSSLIDQSSLQIVGYTLMPINPVTNTENFQGFSNTLTSRVPVFLSLIKHLASLPGDVKAGRQKGITGPGE